MAGPNTLAIMNQMMTFLQGLGLFKTVVLGAQKDWTDAWPVAEVMIAEDSNINFEMGGFKKDIQGFKVTWGTSWTRQTPAAAVTAWCALRDAIVPLFQQHAYMGGLQNVEDSRVKPVPFKVAFMTIGTDDYLTGELIVEVESVWSVPIGAAGI